MPPGVGPSYIRIHLQPDSHQNAATQHGSQENWILCLEITAQWGVSSTGLPKAMGVWGDSLIHKAKQSHLYFHRWFYLVSLTTDSKYQLLCPTNDLAERTEEFPWAMGTKEVQHPFPSPAESTAWATAQLQVCGWVQHLDHTGHELYFLVEKNRKGRCENDRAWVRTGVS
jgi:hypothetical protein